MRKLLWDYKRAFVGLPFIPVMAGQVLKAGLFIGVPSILLYNATFRPFKRVFYDVNDSTLNEA